MDAVQFGRWIADRRRAYGYRSQRILVAKLRATSLPYDLRDGISEDFLARLEAGQLAHPFRGSVRLRVLALAWHLCKTPRDIKTYLKAAELTQLNASEMEYIQLLQERLDPRSVSLSLPLPPRPAHLVGRSSEMQELLHALCTTETGLCMVTGMPGAGKSALADEAIHILASDQHERMRYFPDGIAAFTCTHRKGAGGLISLLQDIATAFDTSTSSKKSVSSALAKHTSTHEDLAASIDRTRIVLAGKRILLLLDGLEADFPLREGLDALLGSDQNGITVLAASRFIPSPALMRYHQHLAPLTLNASLELFTILLGRPLMGNEEQQYAEQICTSVGYLPLAIEAAAAAITVGGIALSLLAACLAENPLDPLLDSEYELRFRLAQALESLEPKLQKHFALLSTLGVRSFGLEGAAAIRTAASENGMREHIYLPVAQDDSFSNSNGNPVLSQLTETAAALEKFVRRSLLDLEATGMSIASPSSSFASNHIHPIRAHSHAVRYRMHPLLHAHALHALEELDSESVIGAARNIQTYSLAYLARHKENLPYLEQERDFLLVSVQRAFGAEQYQQVVQFLDGLMPLCRLYKQEESERLLLCGIHASQQLHDLDNQAKYVFHLGNLYCMYGDLARARQIFQENLDITEKIQNSDYARSSLVGLAHIAHIEGEYDNALQFSEMFLQQTRDHGTPYCIIEAAYIHAFYARLQGKLNIAHEDIQLALQLFSEFDTAKASFHKHMLDMQLKMELARIEGDYARAREYVESVASTMQDKWGGYSLADLLFDQACFAYGQGKHEDTDKLARRVAQIAIQIQAPHFYSRSIQLLRQLAGTTHARFYPAFEPSRDVAIPSNWSTL